MKKLCVTIGSKIENIRLVENFLENLIQEFSLEKNYVGKSL